MKKFIIILSVYSFGFLMGMTAKTFKLKEVRPSTEVFIRSDDFRPFTDPQVFEPINTNQVLVWNKIIREWQWKDQLPCPKCKPCKREHSNPAEETARLRRAHQECEKKNGNDEVRIRF